MRDFFQLPRDRGVDGRVVVAVQVGPDRGVGIEIFPAARVLQDRPVAARDDDRFTFQPVAHLRERMPEVMVVELGESVH